MQRNLLKARTVLFFIAFFIASPHTYSQCTIQGRIIDLNKSAIPQATVMLLQAGDSSLVKLLISDKDGVYVFNNIPNGTYLIAADFIGYKRAYSEYLQIGKIKNTVIVDPLALRGAEAVSLGEVTVSVKKPLLEQKMDRLVINVANSITSTGNTALEVLERSPGIAVDMQNGVISMNGKNGVVVMINGKISHMPSSAVMQLLSGMNSGNIEKIELITAPPANLDAEGNAGYINIVLKENNNFGTNGSFSATLGYGDGRITESSLNINHRKGKINLYGDISYTRNRRHFFGLQYNKIVNAGNTSETYFDLHRIDTTANVNARIGLDWELTKQTFIGVLLSGYDNRYTQAENNTSSILDNTVLDTIIKHNNSEVNHWFNYSGNINLEHHFNQKSKLVLNLDYIYYNDNQPTNYHNSYFKSNNDFINDQYSKSDKKTPIHFEVAAVDYSHSFDKNVSMEAGLKQTISAFNNDLGFARLDQNVWVKDNSLSAIYTLHEDYSAAYVSFNISLDKSTEARAGLRYEYTNSNLGTTDIKNIMDRHYGNLFPSFSISHKINESNSINFSYSRRISRPSFNDLAPYTYYANANTLITGNPALQASVSDNINAGYTFKRYTLTVSYSVEKNAIAPFQPHTDSINNKLVLSPGNIINQKTAAFVLSIPITVTKWWAMQYNFTTIWQQENALYQALPLHIEQASFAVNINQHFTLPKNFSFELSGFYKSASFSGINHLHPFGSLDMGLKKRLPGKGGSIIFSGINMLNTNFMFATYDLPHQNLVGTVHLRFVQPAYKLTYTRSFGKEKLKEKRERVSGAELERSRVQ
jgi:hypothetical protein